MCFQALAPLLAGLGGGAAAAGGIGATLSTFGTVLSAGSAIIGGIQKKQTADYQSRLLTQQAQTEGQLTAIEDERTRRRFASQIGQQRAELAGRGVSLDSPTAVFLGETAAREMTFASQEVRNRGSARQTELSGAASAARARGRQALLGGGLSAAGTILNAAPQLWPGLYDDAVTA